MKSRPVILQLMSGTSVAVHPVCIHKFGDHGFDLIRCASLSEVIDQVWARKGTHDGRMIIIIDACGNEAQQHVSVLRALRPDLGIVALVDPDNEAGIIQLLHAGVDTHCFLSASSDLLIAIVLRLLYRLGAMRCRSSGIMTGPSDPPQPSSWKLVDRGWILRSPAGHRIALTTGERAFLTTLLNAPAQKVTHVELIDAVNASYNNISGHIHQSRLGVMVSRMRRKFKQAGAPLPLKSVHNWGYMFVADSQPTVDASVPGHWVL